MSLATTLLSHSWGEEQRFKFHATFNAWMTTCPEEDYLRLMHLREQVAPGQVCSIVTLLRSCFADPALSAGLPASLVQLMQERNLLQVSSAAPSGAV